MTYLSQIEPHFLSLLRGERTHEEHRAACAQVPGPEDQLRAKGATDADLKHRPRAEQGDSRTLLDLVRDGTWSLARGVAVVEARRARETPCLRFIATFRLGNSDTSDTLQGALASVRSFYPGALALQDDGALVEATTREITGGRVRVYEPGVDPRLTPDAVCSCIFAERGGAR